MSQNTSIIQMIDEMINGLYQWLENHNYNYFECNYVPSSLISKNKKLNVLARSLYRLFPFNIRFGGKDENGMYPITPQTNVALLKAFNLSGNKDICQILLERTLKLKSSKVKNFALRQGIPICINLYENSADDPTPLNTVWFGEYILNENNGIISEGRKKSILYSIANYLINELGYSDFGEEGIYFYYGPTLKKVVYNASAIISAFLLKMGNRYQDSRLKCLGERGITYIINNQNEDGSWFYAASPERPTIDCFHQSYIIQALIRTYNQTNNDLIKDKLEKSINSGNIFYKTLFVNEGKYIYPIRYDKRYTPRNTWLLQKFDGRDIAEALVYFSVYQKDEEMIYGLINTLYYKLFNKKKKYLYPEIFIYGKNHIPYIEFQGWYLYALIIVKNYLDENNITVS